VRRYTTETSCLIVIWPQISFDPKLVSTNVCCCIHIPHNLFIQVDVTLNYTLISDF
jgi:hypothetical protein